MAMNTFQWSIKGGDKVEGVVKKWPRNCVDKSDNNPVMAHFKARDLIMIVQTCARVKRPTG